MKRYWIQERNEYGNYFDSIGFMPEDTFAYCLKQLRDWQKEFPKRTCRLIERIDKVVAQ